VLSFQLSMVLIACFFLAFCTRILTQIKLPPVWSCFPLLTSVVFHCFVVDARRIDYAVFKIVLFYVMPKCECQRRFMCLSVAERPGDRPARFTPVLNSRSVSRAIVEPLSLLSCPLICPSPPSVSGDKMSCHVSVGAAWCCPLGRGWQL